MLEIRCNRQPWKDGVDLLISEKHGELGFWVADPLVMRQLPEFEAANPTMTLSNQAAQNLMDELWQCGLRPSEGTGSAGSLAATERHLADMRKIALGLIKKEGVEL